MSKKSQKQSKLAGIKSKLKSLKLGKKGALVLVASLLILASSFKTGEHQGFRNGELGECNLLINKFMNPQLSPSCSYGITGELEVVIQVPGLGEVRFNQKTGQPVQ